MALVPVRSTERANSNDTTTAILRNIIHLKNCLPTQGEVTELFARNPEGAHELMEGARIIENRISDLKLELKECTSNKQFQRDTKYLHVQCKKKDEQAGVREKWKEGEKRSHIYIKQEQERYAEAAGGKRELRELISFEALQARADQDAVKKLSTMSKVTTWEQKVHMFELVQNENDIKRRASVERRHRHLQSVKEQAEQRNKERSQSVGLEHERNLQKTDLAAQRLGSTLQHKSVVSKKQHGLDETVYAKKQEEKLKAIEAKYTHINEVTSERGEKKMMKVSQMRALRTGKAGLAEQVRLEAEAVERQKQEQELVKYKQRVIAFHESQEEARKQRVDVGHKLRMEQAMESRVGMLAQDEARRMLVLERTRERVMRVVMGIQTGPQKDEEPSSLAPPFHEGLSLGSFTRVFH